MGLHSTTPQQQSQRPTPLPTTRWVGARACPAHSGPTVPSRTRAGLDTASDGRSQVAIEECRAAPHALLTCGRFPLVARPRPDAALRPSPSSCAVVQRSASGARDVLERWSTEAGDEASGTGATGSQAAAESRAWAAVSARRIAPLRSALLYPTRTRTADEQAAPLTGGREQSDGAEGAGGGGRRRGEARRGEQSE